MKDFSFTNPEVLRTLLSAKKISTEFMGSATSDFQSHPSYVNGIKKTAEPCTDWEIQTHHLMHNEKSKIVGKQDISEFPRFFEKKDLYVQRCVDLGENMFRISFDFGRLCPKPEEFNLELMREYVDVLAAIRNKGLEPMLTLYHWPMPIFLLKMDAKENINAGAWENKEILEHFRFYVKNVIKYLSDKDFIREVLQKEGYSQEKQDRFLAEGLVRYFITINEPINLLFPTYILGVFPPFKKLRFDLIRKVTAKIVQAHDIAIDEIRNGHLPAGRGPIKIGVSHNWIYFDGLFGGLLNWLVNSRLTKKFERRKSETDFIGLSYYFRMKFSPFRSKREYGDNPYFGDIYPSGIFEMLKRMNKEYPNKDIFITEFGFSDSTGLRRPFWILETVRYVIGALEKGIPIKGMLLWTLVNNFEWNLGMHQKFGLFHEDELDKPLVPSQNGDIKSWEAWRAAINAFLRPNKENLYELQCSYDIAKRQFDEAVFKKKIKDKTISV